jgi:hypothetical protein
MYPTVPSTVPVTVSGSVSDPLDDPVLTSVTARTAPDGSREEIGARDDAGITRGRGAEIGAPGSSAARAMPKSVTRTRPSSPTSTLSGLKSR